VVAHPFDDRRRVEAAAEEGAHGHVADHLEPNGFVESVTKLLDELLVRSFVGRTGGVRSQIPESPAGSVPAFPCQ